MTNYRLKEYHVAMLTYATDAIAKGAQRGDVIASLIAMFNCSRATAYRVTRKAFQMQDGTADLWGGKREGSGRKKRDSE